MADTNDRNRGSSAYFENPSARSSRVSLSVPCRWKCDRAARKIPLWSGNCVRAVRKAALAAAGLPPLAFIWASARIADASVGSTAAARAAAARAAGTSLAAAFIREYASNTLTLSGWSSWARSSTTSAAAGARSRSRRRLARMRKASASAGGGEPASWAVPDSANACSSRLKPMSRAKIGAARSTSPLSAQLFARRSSTAAASSVDVPRSIASRTMRRCSRASIGFPVASLSSPSRRRNSTLSGHCLTAISAASKAAATSLSLGLGRAARRRRRRAYASRAAGSGFGPAASR